jgi:ligand-binding sensor domain-containing protein
MERRSGERHIWGILPLFFLLMGLVACAPGTGILGGGDWQTNGLRDTDIRVLAVNPKNPQEIYAGDETGHIFMSANAGQQWVERNTGLPLPDSLYALSLDADGKELFAATEKGLFVSTDAAQHWKTLLSPSSGLPSASYTALFFDPAASNTIYVGTVQKGIFVSTDGGSTWHAASEGLPQGATVNGLAFDPDLKQLWVATASPTGIYRSSDKGASWQAFMNGLPSNIVINTVQTAAASGGAQGLIYAGTNQGFFLSEDAGAHWMRSQMSLSGTSVHAILVDFRSNNGSTVYIGTDFSALRSDDKGQNWQNVATGLPKGTSVYDLSLGATNYAQLYAAADKLYLFPGVNSASDPNRIVPLVLILFFFYLLLRMTTRTRLKRRPVSGSRETRTTP